METRSRLLVLKSKGAKNTLNFTCSSQAFKKPCAKNLISLVFNFSLKSKVLT